MRMQVGGCREKPDSVREKSLLVSYYSCNENNKLAWCQLKVYTGRTLHHSGVFKEMMEASFWEVSLPFSMSSNSCENVAGMLMLQLPLCNHKEKVKRTTQTSILKFLSCWVNAKHCLLLDSLFQKSPCGDAGEHQMEKLRRQVDGYVWSSGDSWAHT